MYRVHSDSCWTYDLKVTGTACPWMKYDLIQFIWQPLEQSSGGHQKTGVKLQPQILKVDKLYRCREELSGGRQKSYEIQ